MASGVHVSGIINGYRTISFKCTRSDDDGELAVGKYVVQWAGHKLAIILLYNDIFETICYELLLVHWHC